MNLTKNTKVTRVKNAVAAGASDVTDATIIDMAGFDSVTYAVAFGTIVSGAATSIKVQQGDAANLSDAADITGASITVADTDDNKVFLLEVKQPAKRYNRIIVSRATQNSTVDGIIAIQSEAKSKPTTHDATTVSSKFVQQP